MDTEDKNYDGDTPEVDSILALRTEKITKKLTFDTFREKLATYINIELTHATDVVCVVKHIKGTKINFYNNNKPKDLTEEEAKSSMNKMIQDQEVKQYVYKKQDFKNNLKLFSLSFGVNAQAVWNLF